VSGLQWFLTDPWVRFLVFVGVAGFVAYLFFMKRTLRQLDPSGIIPTRVKAALDALTQGVVMIDTRDFIVLANDAFCQAVGKPVTSLIGSDLSTLSWTAVASSATVSVHPWTAAIMGVQPQAAGTALFLSLPDGGSRKLIVNTVPIMDDGSTVKGALVSFYDVTELERASSQLREANSELKASRAQMLEKDQEIEEAHTSLLVEMNKRKKADDEKEELYQQLTQLVRQANMGKGEAAA
jgi:PAS domain S-box-containing protein